MNVWARGLAGLVSGVLVGVVAVPAGAEPIITTVGEPTPLEERAGPYAETDAPEVDAPLEPRKAAAQDLTSTGLQAGDEVLTERTASSKTFVGEEAGTFETRLYGGPVHFPAADRNTEEPTEWVEIDTDLAPAGSGRVAPAATDVEMSIAQSSGDESLVHVELGEDAGSISWGLSTIGDGQARGQDVPVEGEVEGSTVSYDVADDVQVLVQAVPTGVKEDMILAGPDAPTTYEFALTLEGVEAIEAGGGVHFIDGDDEVVASIPAGFMEDANGVFSDGVELSLTGEGTQQVLRVEIDQDWLNEPDRAFPVAVDPTVNLTNGLQDTHVRSDRQANFSGYPDLRTGLALGGSKARALMKFDLSFLSGKAIDDAQLRLFNERSLTCTPSEVAVYAATQAWDQATVSWPGPALETAKAGSVDFAAGGLGCTPDWTSIEVDDLVNGWASGDITNHGLAVVSSETSTNGYREFTSSEGLSTNRPYLFVSWREPLLGNLGYYTLNTEQLTDRTQMHVNVATGNLMIQAADVQVPGVADMGLSIGRWYNSREDTTHAGIPGSGWALDTGSDIRFSVPGAGQSGFFEGPSGYRIIFPANSAADGGFDKPVGLNATATALSSGPSDYKVEMHATGMSYYFMNGPALDYVEDKRGNRISLTYGAGERVSSITDTKGGVTTFTYGSNNRVATITDPFNRVASYTYNGLTLASTTDFAGKSTQYTYDNNQNLSSLTDPRGNTTSFTYDSADRLTRIDWADGGHTTYTHPSGGNVGRVSTVLMTDPNGGEPWEYQFDNNGRLLKFISPRAADGESYAYDAFNSVSDYTTNSGGTGTALYDGYNVTSFQGDSGAESTFEYDDDSNAPNRPVRYTDSKGVTLDYQYNNDQEMTHVSNDGAIKAQMTYRTASQSCSGSLASAKDGNNNTTTYTYNSRCNLTKITRPAPLGAITMTYDSLDRLASVTDGVGNKQTHTYDSMDRLIRTNFFAPGAAFSTSRVIYTYDVNGNRTARTDVHPGQGTKTSAWALDARNRLTTETLPGVTNSYTYDLAGNLATMTTPWGTTSYTYDDENDVATITPPVGNPINFDYDEHTYAAVVFPNGVHDAQHYDTDGRIQQIDQYRTGGLSTTQLARLEYSYTDPAGNPTESVHEISDPIFNVETNYTYDTNGRIETSHGVSEGDIFENNSYTYDNNSNRTAWSTAGIGNTTTNYTAQFNAANQMTSMARAGGPTNTYSYDANGALTSATDGTAISYDIRGRASSTTHKYGGSLGAQAATYDGASQVERTSYGSTTFKHSILGVASTTTAEGTRNYVRAPDGRVLAEYRPDGSWRYYLSDHLGSIVGGTDSDGTRTESYGYDAYGDYTYGSGGGTDLIGFRYTGEWLDGNSVTGNGYYKIGHRNYDSQLGRWTQTDPLHRATNATQPSEANPYNYAGCNPTNQTDPSGAYSWKNCLAAFFGLSVSIVGMIAGVVGAPATSGWSVWATRLAWLGYGYSVYQLADSDCLG